MALLCQPIFGRFAGPYHWVVFDPFTECFTVCNASLGGVNAVLHYECFTDAYFFFGLVDVDSPQILLRFRMISLVSSMLPGSGFFRPKSLKSLAFLVLLRSSLMDFLKGGFFSLIMYILILEANKVKRLCRQNQKWQTSFGVITICCDLYLGPTLDVVA